MNRKRRTARATAQLILLNAKSYEEERGRQLSRYRFSQATLRQLAGRLALRDRFLSDLEEEVAELGWLFFPFGADFAVLDISKADSWTKLGWKRLKESGTLDQDDGSIDEIFNQLFPDEPDEPDDD